MMGVAPPDAKIDEVAAKMRADPKRLEEQERWFRRLSGTLTEFEAQRMKPSPWVREGKEPDQK
jgi:hypothetical protein